MNRQRGHVNEDDLDTLVVTCTVHQKEIADAWSVARNLSSDDAAKSG